MSLNYYLHTNLLTYKAISSWP